MYYAFMQYSRLPWQEFKPVGGGENFGGNIDP